VRGHLIAAAVAAGNITPADSDDSATATVSVHGT